jgi:hypothetical protein
MLTAHRSAVAVVLLSFLPIRAAEACSDATESNKKVHLDLPHGQLGDDTTQRWGFLGLVEVTP